MDTGTYLRPHDMVFCIERTKFSEDQTVAWFKRYALNYLSFATLFHYFSDHPKPFLEDNQDLTVTVPEI